MKLKALKINGLRNLEEVVFDGLQRFNFIYGKNGSGKTSVLEAIHILGTARSFRTQKNSALINSNHPQFTVFAVLEDSSTVGVEKTRSASTHKYKVNHEIVGSAAELAQHLPLHLINNETFDLLAGAPSVRRSFIDRGVFHVEHGFLSCWKRSQKALKQRNILLKHGKISRDELRPWDIELAENTELIHGMRKSFIDRFSYLLARLVSRCLETDEPLVIRYKPGWDESFGSFETVLDASFDKDMVSGFSNVGPHRADIQIKLGGSLALDVLSRGQQKVLVALMQIAQSQCISEETGAKSVFLIDDLPSELDQSNRQLVLSLLSELESQVFITSIDKKDIVDSIPGRPEAETDFEKAAWFHVEHGKVSKTENHNVTY